MKAHKFLISIISFQIVLMVSFTFSPVRAASDESDKTTATQEQIAGVPEQTDSRWEKGTSAKNPTWGDFDPGEGFLVGQTEHGKLDISGFAVFRVMDQITDDTFTDHLGNEHPVDGRLDLYSHRVMVWLKGWMASPKLIYAITFWTVNATDQKNIFANIGYQFSKGFNLYTGVNGNPGTRSLLGSHPYWLGNDRVMADEFFRPFFGMGVYANGEVVPGMFYAWMVGNSNSTLGTSASKMDRKLTYGGSVWWMPTTQEFGPKGGYGDYEMHEELATRFGISTTYSPEQRYNNAPNTPDNSTLKLADSVNVFEIGALAPGVTVDNVTYQVLSLDAGMKYRGIFLQTEFYTRWLSKFKADGPVPVDEIVDTGFYVQAAFFPIPQKFELYAATSQIFGDKDAGFDNSSEYLLGANWYFTDTRNHRINFQFMDINHSPVGSSFGYYTGGMNGYEIETAISIFF
jgi:hypothetical protein